jgi:hypothetical protein
MAAGLLLCGVAAGVVFLPRNRGRPGETATAFGPFPAPPVRAAAFTETAPPLEERRPEGTRPSGQPVSETRALVPPRRQPAAEVRLTAAAAPASRRRAVSRPPAPVVRWTDHVVREEVVHAVRPGWMVARDGSDERLVPGYLETVVAVPRSPGAASVQLAGFHPAAGAAPVETNTPSGTENTPGVLLGKDDR